MWNIAVVGEADLPELLPLVRGYLDFYEVQPTDADMLALSRALIADPEKEGQQFIARTDDGTPGGFATLFWTWSTTRGTRIGVMNDLFVAPESRGTGLADQLIHACADRCRERGAKHLDWSTALDNHRAQTVYDRVGGQRSQWLDYSLPIES